MLKTNKLRTYLNIYNWSVQRLLRILRQLPPTATEFILSGPRITNSDTNSYFLSTNPSYELFINFSILVPVDKRFIAE